MPPKIRDLIAELERNGFVNRGGKGSHRNFEHSLGERVTISGKLGEDAMTYQEKLVRKSLRKVTEK
ncbi:MAG: type II toxin-antitoxin system HicA family toxin [Pyrinomonadaceae bacterium]